LLTQAPTDPALRFNLAWVRAMTGQLPEALALLGEPNDVFSGESAALKVQILHSLGRIDEALAKGQVWLAQHPHQESLAGALAATAIDANAPTLARQFAAQAGSHHDGRTAAGMLDLRDGALGSALVAFEAALTSYPFDARALLGKGLVRLAQGRANEASRDIERSAELFRTHLGSWVAAGWASFAADDLIRARQLFDRAMVLDENFAETHGALAVLDLAVGDRASAERRTEIAFRLDRRCFAAALSKSLMLQLQGDVQGSTRIRALAFNSPIGPGGQTLAQAMASLNAGIVKARGPNL
jgi:tetratricopeptide (TPR) repeat protein